MSGNASEPARSLKRTKQNEAEDPKASKIARLTHSDERLVNSSIRYLELCAIWSLQNWLLAVLRFKRTKSQIGQLLLRILQGGVWTKVRYQHSLSHKLQWKLTLPVDSSLLPCPRILDTATPFNSFRTLNENETCGNSLETSNINTGSSSVAKDVELSSEVCLGMVKNC